MKRILLVEDDLTFGLMLKTWLSKRNFIITHVGNVVEAEKKLNIDSYDIILSDLRLPDKDGVDLLKWMNAKNINVPFIIMTSYAEVQTAVLSMKLGAVDYIEKPINPEDLLKKINDICPKDSVVNSEKCEIIGNSDMITRLREYIRLISPTSMSVFIKGEFGVGKLFIANIIAKSNDKFSRNIKIVNCKLLDSDKKFVEDLVSQGSNGTIIFENINDLSAELKQQLRCAIQDKIFISNNIRLISVSESDLDDDLEVCLNEFFVELLPIRERKGDIMLFANYFLEKFNQEFGKNIIGFNSEVIKLFTKYDWPRNISEIQNVVRKAVILSESDFVECKDVPDIVYNNDNIENKFALKNKDYEKECIIKVLKECNFNKTQTAQVLHIDRKTLYNKLKLYGI